jgi:hypothetical protein
MDTTIDHPDGRHRRVYAGRLLVETLSEDEACFARRMPTVPGGQDYRGRGHRDLTRVNADRRRQEATVDAAQQVLFERDEETLADTLSTRRAARNSRAPARPAGDDPPAARATLRGLPDHRQALDGQVRGRRRDPALRPRLIEMMKSHLHGIARRNG